MSNENEIFVRDLTFSFAPLDPAVPPSLVNISLALPKGSRTILIGANGGKGATLIPTESGLMMIPASSW